MSFGGHDVGAFQSAMRRAAASAVLPIGVAAITTVPCGTSVPHTRASSPYQTVLFQTVPPLSAISAISAVFTIPAVPVTSAVFALNSFSFKSNVSFMRSMPSAYPTQRKTALPAS